MSVPVLLVGILGCAPAVGEGPLPPAPPVAAPVEAAAARVGEIAAPEGFSRTPAEGYAAWIRNLPLRAPGTPVRSWRGDTVISGSSPSLLAVVDLSVGEADLQQCADTILRLRIEWLWQRSDAPEIAFRFTSGDLSSWSRWAAGDRPVIRGNKVSWARTAAPDSSRENLDRWMASLFTYAGTRSLAREGVAATGVLPGDFLVTGGSPGHAVVVLDVAQGSEGQTAVLVGEGYMPAQDLHLLRGPLDGWYPVGEALAVPTWPDPFPWAGLRRFVP